MTMTIKAVFWRLRKLAASLDRVGALADMAGRPGLGARKSRRRRFAELLYLALRWDEYSTAYHAQGMDARSASLRRDFLPVGRFNALRGRWNRNRAYPDENYEIVFEDKLVFERYFGACGLPVVRSFGVALPPLSFVDRAGARCADLRQEWPAGLPAEVFCKPLAGRYGKGAVAMRWLGGELAIAGADGAAIAGRGLGVAAIVQERLEQHPVLAGFHPSSLNTLRIVTVFDDAHGVSVAGGFFRMGVGGAVVDNASAGGVICGFDLARGTLAASAFQVGKASVRAIDAHPSTGCRFAGVTIPFFDEALALVRAAHRAAPWIRSIGWDVAIRADGPVLIEGNNRWGPLSLMWVDPSFLPRMVGVMK